MTFAQFLAMLNAEGILNSDSIVFENANGAQLMITNVSRSGGSTTMKAGNAPVVVTPVVTIQFAVG